MSIMNPPQSTSSHTTQQRDLAPDNEPTAASFQLLSYLRSLSAHERLDLYSVSITDLTKTSLLDPPILENHKALFLEALNFAEIRKTFIAVPCYFCSNFNSSSTDENTSHVMKNHMVTPPLEILAMLPKKAPYLWITDYNTSGWSPLDPTTFRLATSPKEGERLLLSQIKPIFRYLAGQGFFTVNHIAALAELVTPIPSRQRLIEATSKHSNVCIRVLGAPQLETALRFLEALKTCALNVYNADFISEEAQDQEKFQIYLEPDEVSVFLMKYGKRPGDLVRWLYDPSEEVSRSSWKVAVEAREHKIRLVMRELLQVLVRMVRDCQMKKKRLDHSNAMNRLRYLSEADLKKRLCTSVGIEKIAIGEILQEMRDLQGSNQEISHIQELIDKKIRQLHFLCLLIDARILSALKYMEELHPKIGHASILDYRIVVVPLMKYCMKKCLEILLEQNSRDQSKSDREAQKMEPRDKLGDGEGPCRASNVEKSPQG